MQRLLKNCHVVSPDYDVAGVAILIENERIKQLFVGDDVLPDTDKTIDIGGRLVMPGFIDVHCHGRSGQDFCDGTKEAVETIAIDKLKEGVTTWLPTTLTIGEEQLAAALKSAADYVASGAKGCKVPGVHLEGPFINPKCLGAQNPDFVRLPDIDEVKRLNAIFPVLKLSYAVEVAGGAEFAAALLAEGIVPSCVHSAAGYAEFARANRRGLKNLSHFCNQMTALHHRDIGLVGSGLLHDEVFIEVICDLLHLCPEMVKLIFKVKDIERIQLITDAIRASGMPDGEYEIGGLPLILKDGAARLKEGGALAGSTLQFCVALRNVAAVTGIELGKLIMTTSWNQAQALGLPGLGRIEPGYFADLVVLDDQLTPEIVLIDGEVRYNHLPL